MNLHHSSTAAPSVPAFDRTRPVGSEPFTRIGGGSNGAKANGLLGVREIVERTVRPSFAPDLLVEIPPLTVIGTDCFELFLRQNELSAATLVGRDDEEIARQVTNAELPAELLADLQALGCARQTPLAVRSSSLLEDDLREPLAGVYATKMIPNSHPDVEIRLGQLAQAVKHVYASTFFRAATAHAEAMGRSTADERMAVLVQEVVGARHGGRFYPHLSGVARSANFYPLGIAKPGDGSISLALGLGRIIVDEGVAWSYSPACPQANPPYGKCQELLEQAQREFWAIELATQACGSDPPKETEFLSRHALAAAEQDGALDFLASTYDPDDDRITPGLARRGQRLLDFAPILKAGCLQLNALVQELLRTCERELRTLVEIEFALTFPASGPTPARFGLLQVRPMKASHAEVEVAAAELAGPRVLLASESALGNGRLTGISDLVYVRPEAFEPKHTRAIAQQLESANQILVADRRPYVLIGFGRWGSSDPGAGIPVEFGQIAGAQVIVEATLPNMDHRPSQGTHFFHNLTRFDVLYFSVHHQERPGIDWAWLDAQPARFETSLVRHVRIASPLEVKVDGRVGRGVITHG